MPQVCHCVFWMIPSQLLGPPRACVAAAGIQPHRMYGWCNHLKPSNNETVLKP